MSTRELHGEGAPHFSSLGVISSRNRLLAWIAAGAGAGVVISVALGTAGAWSGSGASEGAISASASAVPQRTRLHPLMSILVIALLTMICVGEGWEDMEEFGLAKQAWLETFLDLPHGIPSEDTFRRVLSALNPKAFNACFIAWVQALAQGTSGKLIPIDGKTIRRSFNRATGKKALHVVSAWVANNRLTLGQIVTEEKSNEITAIPKLLELLDVRGATVTIDAMGCQKAIAEKIVDQDADYIMGLKGNQTTAHKEVEDFFTDAHATAFRDVEHTFHQTVDGSDHGRLEVRRVWASQQLDWFADGRAGPTRTSVPAGTPIGCPRSTRYTPPSGSRCSRCRSRRCPPRCDRSNPRRIRAV